MANVVFAWELGGGFGHVGPFRPIAERLIDVGHSVTAIVKDLPRAAKAFHGLPIPIYQAPVKLERATPYDPAPATFCHLLQNTGFGDTVELAATIQAWRNLFQAIQPDGIVFDHCPTGLVAARGLAIPQYTIGPGFQCPVDEFPLREMASWRVISLEDRTKCELKLVTRINQVLAENGQPTIDRVGEVYSSVTENLLTTFKEFDHFPYRPDHEYLGTWPSSGTLAKDVDTVPSWPEGTGSNVFAYVGNSKAIKPLLMWLGGQGHRTIVIASGGNIENVSDGLPPSVRVFNHHVDLRVLRKSCELAITNGNHGTSCEFLLAGCPLLVLPKTLEQALFSRRIVELGAGLDASPDQPRQAIHQVSAMLSIDRFRSVAVAFSQKHESFKPDVALEKCVQKIVAHL